MFKDVIDIRDFYMTRLGKVARRLVRRRIRQVWPNVQGMSVVGYGYAIPYLRPFTDDTPTVVSLMPAGQGVVPWPTEGPCRTALVEDNGLPLADATVDRLLVVHSFEFVEQLRSLVREFWRVLSPGGRILIVVPNRRSLWSLFDHTPFGHGRSYSVMQIHQILRDLSFVPLHTDYGLYIPPSQSPLIAVTSRAWEKMGQRWWKKCGGVILIEATKQVYAVTPPLAKGRKVLARPRSDQGIV